MKYTMKYHAVTCVAIAISLLSVGPVYAQDGPNRGAEANKGQAQARQGQAAQHQPGRAPSARGPEHMNAPSPRAQERGNQQRGHANESHQDERGAGPDHGFHRGERMPPENRSHHYVVDNWHDHGLRAPPRGYQWVQSGSDYVLVAIATGVILDLLLSH